MDVLYAAHLSSVNFLISVFASSDVVRQLSQFSKMRWNKVMPSVWDVLRFVACGDFLSIVG